MMVALYLLTMMISDPSGIYLIPKVCQIAVLKR